MNKNFLTAIGIIGSLASIIGLIYLFIPSTAENKSTQTQTQSGNNNMQAGSSIIINNNESSSGGKIYLYEQKIENYWNEWYANPLKTRDKMLKNGPSVLVTGEGKTVEFSGILDIDCGSGRKSWRSVQNFNSLVEDKTEIDQMVPKEVYHAICKIFYYRDYR